jgi:PAS domain S-box-containing protein
MISGGDHAQHHDEYLKRYLRTGEARAMGKRRELPAKRKDGTEFPIELGLVEISNETNQEKMFVGFIRDLTEIKKKENLAIGIVAASIDPVIGVDEKGIVQFVNDAIVNQFGYTEEELVGNSINCIVGSKHAAKHDSYLENYLKTGKAKLMGTRRVIPARRKDGSEFQIELGLSEVKAYDGKGRIFVGFVRDLTEIKKKENLAIGIVAASIDPVIGIDEKGIVQFVNDATVKQFGYTEEELVGNSINCIVGSKHTAEHDSYLENYLKTGKAKLMGTRRVIPARRKDGSEFQIELGLSEVKAYDGKGRVFVGFIRDLTEIKKKENLAIGIVAASIDPVIGVDEKGIVQFVNDATVNQFGYTEEELVGNSINCIVGSKHTDEQDSYLENYLKTGKAKLMGTRRAIPARRKDGSEFPIELGLSEIKSYSGSEKVFVGFIRDLSDHKEDK